MTVTSEPAGVKPITSQIQRWVTPASISLCLWLVFAANLLIQSLLRRDQLMLTTDDAMRLSQVRDLLAGQSWFDLTQWRMNPPAGLPMHWSRLIDAPIALLIVLFRQFFDAATAETLAICIWPLLTLLAVWQAIARIATRLAGPACGFIAVFLALSSTSVFGYFAPAEIDHHNAQVALTLWSIACLVEFDTRPMAALWLGVVSVASLAIGLEVLPYVATSAVIVLALWIGKDGIDRAVVRYGLAVAGSAVVALFGATATHEARSLACDAYSGYYAAAAIVGGLGLAGAAYVTRDRGTRTQKGVVAGLLAVALIVLTLTIAPRCLAGPYAEVDPRLYRIFMSRIEEVRSPLLTASDAWAPFLTGYIYSALGLAASAVAWTISQKADRTAIGIVAAFAAVALAITSIQARGVPFALFSGLPGLAMAIRELVKRRTRTGLSAAAATIWAVLLSSNVAFGFVGVNLIEGTDHALRRVKAEVRSRNCFEPQESMRQLAGLPRGRVAAFEDQGPAVIAYTPHAVIGGPYHRNTAGILDTYAIFTARPEVSAAILKRRGINYLLTCRSGGDHDFYLSESGRDGLMRRLETGTIPNWLMPLPPSGPERQIQIYVVNRKFL